MRATTPRRGARNKKEERQDLQDKQDESAGVQGKRGKGVILLGGEKAPRFWNGRSVIPAGAEPGGAVLW